MEWTGLNELREMFLAFFESKGHLRLPSFPLVPKGDKSLLLINSGMAPMKKWFLGTEEPPSHRVCTCQKCIRTPDIESVGITARHGTYFEMLGNFSFRDYFKKEAIQWAWEFFTSDDWLAIPAERLYCSVYEEDDDAYRLWTEEVGVPADHMVRLGKADNFWEHGSGPCGPCSEIYFDRGEAYGCGKPTCAPGCDCDRYMEVWNLVFTEFDSDGAGHYEKLAKPNIDTGMGLERLACVLQNAENLFETDTVQAILHHVERIAGKTYGEDRATDISIRVVTDHIRSTAFMVSDGVLPANEGRGYVLRRLLRRAARHGRMLGITRPFLAEVCDTVIAQNERAYPELREHADFIKKTIDAEEKRFLRTIDQGLTRLNEMLEGFASRAFKEAERVLPGEDVFRLHDTFGFPLDLTREIAAERGIGVDLDGFMRALQRQRDAAREDRKRRDIAGWEADLFSGIQAEPTAFTGYETLHNTARVVALSDGESLCETLTTEEGERDGVLVVLDKTPFYAEGGGQVADTGRLVGADCELAVHSVKQATGGFYVHACTLLGGVVRVGDEVDARVDENRRRSIMRNHTAAHLLQQALREVLGEHVHQAGSFVDDERVRFDFTHTQGLSREELRRVEDIVNDRIFEALPVDATVMPLADAKQKGAIALFGEKYGNEVRVVDVQGFSCEFCGGTHVHNTAELGSFKVLAESSVAAGVRRIEGTTGRGVLKLLDEREAMLGAVGNVLRVANLADLPQRVANLASEMREAVRELAKMRDAAADKDTDAVFERGVEVAGVRVYTGRFAGLNPDGLRKLCDRLRARDPLCVGVFAGGEKPGFVACCGEEAVKKGVKAGDLVRQVAALTGGSGGGKPEFAMAGAKDAQRVDEALAAVPELVEKMLG